jgi:hypothetical protein
MFTFETYRAREGADIPPVAEGLGAAPPGPTAFTIEVRFLPGLTDNQKSAFRLAARRWTKVITGDLPDVKVEGELIDDLMIFAQGVSIDGPGKILGQAGPTHLRPSTAGAAALLPARGLMSFDTADLSEMEQKGTLNDVITHEMGHVLGIGTIWKLKNLIAGSGSNNPVFTGAGARKAWGKLKGGGPQDVPVENKGGPGTKEGHWRESTFRNELMSGFISTPGNPLSAVTVASLADLGYQVDMAAAEDFSLFAPEAAPGAADGTHLDGMITIIPMELSKAALVGRT